MLSVKVVKLNYRVENQALLRIQPRIKEMIFTALVLTLTSCSYLPFVVQQKTVGEAGVNASVPSASATATTTHPKPVPTSTGTPVPICESKQGTLEAGMVRSQKLDKPMDFLVYLPPCYSFDESVRYPVIYLLHGQLFDQQQWVRIGATNAADEMISSGQVSPFIMVFPYDYSIKQPNQYAFEDVFLHQLIPQVDETYRTKLGSANRAVGGVSRGGAWALHLGIRNPTIFGAIGGHSPVIFFADHQNLPIRLLQIPANELPRIWIDIGDSDNGLQLIQQFEQLLTDHKIAYTGHIFAGYHEEKYWSTHIRDYLKWYTQDW